MIRSTRIILSNLATKTLSTLLMGTKEIVTIRKSKIFQPSLKNLTKDLSEIIRIITEDEEVIGTTIAQVMVFEMSMDSLQIDKVPVEIFIK